MAMTLVKLMEQEREFLLHYVDPIATISFWTISPQQKYSRVEKYLRSRIDLILSTNPWLCGRLVEAKSETDAEREVSLSYHPQPCSFQEYSCFLCDDDLFHLTDWKSISDYVTPFIPKIGIRCVGVDEILCRFVIFRNEGSDKLAIMFALNHTIGDGWTFYSLWKMLDEDQPVLPMDPQRAGHIEHFYDNEHSHPGLWIHKKVELSNASSGAKNTRKKSILMYKVQNDAMRRMKERYNNSGDGTYVSTNDVLCSWFFGGCHSTSCASITVNVREINPHVKKNMAGNYIISCPIDTSGNPRDFHDRWKKILRGEKQSEKVCGDNWSTNTLGLYHEVKLEGCEHVLHLPVFRWTDLEERSGDCFMFLWKLNAAEVGLVLGVDRNTFYDDYFQGIDFLQDAQWSGQRSRL